MLSAEHIFSLDDEIWSPILDVCHSTQVVALGDATHGTHEFYHARAQLTKILIEQHGFQIIALEGTWTEVDQVNQVVQGWSKRDPSKVLSAFERFPGWVWRNPVVADFVAWLKGWNQTCIYQTGVYGLDIFAPQAAATAVLSYLQQHNPDLYQAAQKRYCRISNPLPAQHQALTQAAQEQLRELQNYSNTIDDPQAQVATFSAIQNARVVKNGLAYEHLFRSGANPTNLRSEHMFEQLLAIQAHLQTQTQQPAKVIIWAHNTHVGDSRATTLGRQRGEISLGQRLREHFGSQAVLLGCTTYSGTVRAASHWQQAAKVQDLLPAIEGSYEHLFHQHGGNFGMLLNSDLPEPLLLRSIGAVYRPKLERQSHYILSNLPTQFDIILHYDQTKALEALL